jgi:hypothetical protein
MRNLKFPSCTNTNFSQDAVPVEVDHEAASQEAVEIEAVAVGAEVQIEEEGHRGEEEEVHLVLKAV